MLTVLSVAYPLAPVGPDSAGGAEQILHTIDQGLVQRGHRSLVIACQGSRAAGTLLPVEAPPASIDTAAWGKAHKAYRKAIETALARFPVDVVHMHGLDFRDYLPGGDIPVLATLHLPPSWYPAGSLSPTRPNIHFNCVSATQRRSCPLGVDPDAVIPNGVPLPTCLPSRHKRRFVLMLGRICPEKGYHLGLDAARLADAPARLCGTVFGYEAHRRYFDEAIAPRLDRRRRFTGPVGAARKCRLLAAAQCLLVPSLAPETSSLVAMEAMACGTPVIASPAGALKEVVGHGRTGYLVESVEEMARAIRAVGAISPSLCRSEARRRFAASAMVDRYIALYRRLTAR
jgi:glycosyltransferase involved in cell wall biosynthesis